MWYVVRGSLISLGQGLNRENQEMCQGGGEGVCLVSFHFTDTGASSDLSSIYLRNRYEVCVCVWGRGEGGLLVVFPTLYGNFLRFRAKKQQQAWRGATKIIDLPSTYKTKIFHCINSVCTCYACLYIWHMSMSLDPKYWVRPSSCGWLPDA